VASGPNDELPNILFILTDDQAPGTLGVDGNRRIRTPRLDRLAEQGAFFPRTYVPIPQCAPSRAAILTGLYPHQNGVTSNTRPRLKPGVITFPELLKRRGYACGLIGKWHLGRDQQPQRGFEDLWITYKRPGPGLDPELFVDGEWRPHEGYVTDILTDYAIRFVEERSGEPFFLWLNYKGPHYPYVPPPGPEFAYDVASLPLPANMDDDLSGKPGAQRTALPHKLFRETSLQEMRRLLSVYYAMISSLDHNVGRILDRLQELGLEEETLVLFMSDNGYMHGEHRMLSKGPMLYEELVRTPMIMRWPGRITPGTKVQALVSSLDLFPTLSRAAGVSPPPGLAGAELWPLLAGQATSLREALFFEYEAAKLMREPVPMRGVVTERYKYTRYLDDGEELYDLRNDPQEMRNLIGEKDHRETADALRERLAEWRRTTGDAGQ
jgi:arylsulfatase A-like enzyme